MSDTDDGQLPASTHVGRVRLCADQPERLREFYESVAGLERLEDAGERGADGDSGVTTLGAGEVPLLELAPAPDRPPRGPDETGLFHLAVRYPTRQTLADSLARAEAETRLDGASDHRVSQALYLRDPDDNGVEFYWDRPQDEWPIAPDGSVEMTTEPLSLDGLRAEGDPNSSAPGGTDVGHVHLEVSSIEASRRFYVDALGLRRRQAYGDEALFLAAGDYHHHVGLNVWNRRNDTATGRGLDWFELRVPSTEALAAARSRLDAAGHPITDHQNGLSVTDPDGIEVRLTATE